MACKPQTFKLDNKKKTITIYTNVEQVESEKTLIEYYLKMGYAPLMGEKKSKSVAEMRAEMKDDEQALKLFNDTYKSKEKNKGFFGACKVYNNWKKANKK